MLLSTSSDFNSRSKTITVGVLLTLLLIFSFSSLRHESWLRLYDFFLWLETTPFGVLGKTWGAVFAIVEAVHLLAMALLGGAVLISDARLLGWCFTDVPAVKIQNEAHKVFKVGLVVVLFTGVFMACGVAGKVYWLPVFWYKMLALATGIFFVFFIRRPMLQRNFRELNPWVVKLVAVSSMLVWITVAATGRWIGFAGS
mgnify:CR=1 FL=1|jgi:hypothetical protein|tara:strand:+ start:62212 stop:62808 length:597 start_codon:yes stop_codon:yes gene_type:complete